MLVFTTVELNIKETFSICTFSFKFSTKKLAVRKFLTNPDNQVIVKTARTKVSKKIILIVRIRQIFSDGPAKITHNDSDKSRGSIHSRVLSESFLLSLKITNKKMFSVRMYASRR